MNNKTKQALLIVDVQRGVMERTINNDTVLKNINLLIGKARGSSQPVIWVQHASENLVRGSARWEIVGELNRESEDILIEKEYNSSFEETTLEGILRDRGINEIILTGAQTNWCIRATAYGALERGFNLTLIRDGHTTEPEKLENGTSIDPKGIIDDLNVAMSWLRYPGRTCRTASAEEFQFS